MDTNVKIPIVPINVIVDGIVMVDKRVENPCMTENIDFPIIVNPSTKMIWLNEAHDRNALFPRYKNSSFIFLWKSYLY